MSLVTNEETSFAKIILTSFFLFLKIAQDFLQKAKTVFYICKKIRCISSLSSLGELGNENILAQIMFLSVHTDFKADGHGNLLLKISLKSYQFSQIFEHFILLQEAA